MMEMLGRETVLRRDDLRVSSWRMLPCGGGGVETMTVKRAGGGGIAYQQGIIQTSTPIQTHGTMETRQASCRENEVRSDELKMLMMMMMMMMMMKKKGRMNQLNERVCGALQAAKRNAQREREREREREKRGNPTPTLELSLVLAPVCAVLRSLSVQCSGAVVQWCSASLKEIIRRS